MIASGFIGTSSPLMGCARIGRHCTQAAAAGLRPVCPSHAAYVARSR